MQDIVSPLQSISYTKKDFQTIYPELLDLVKQLTNKWDPSISNESDPGVILIKLNALIADKCNYNIDKNVLECFPLSVTQNHNARQLFEQLGYYMKWYRSATSLVSLKWIGELNDYITFPIPAFTMITDTDKTVVYTITGYIPSTMNTEFVVGDVTLPQNGSVINVKCIQGVAVKYDIDGDTVITPQHLDSDNRIYFNTSNIAENGIFITNVGSTTNYGQWERKDNLLIEDFGNYYYKFGITSDGTSCYLEFPEDCEAIMKDGIQITYIKSDGEYGNITANQLTNFYSDLSVLNSAGDQIVLNSQNVKIKNYFASNNGKDYEDINEAYKNYKRIVGTFNTLVTLRDYFNYIVSNNLVSNGFVCDRSNDLQNVYNIMTYQNGINELESVIETDSNQPSLTAFSIKLYLTKYYEDVSTTNSFNGTFQPISETEAETIQQYVEDLKSLQHDFVPLDSPNGKFSHYCMFKNKYPINCNIIPQYAVSDAQKADIINNVKLALYQYLNAKEIEFGDKIQSAYVQKIILESDNRIKSVMLDNIEYTTYAVYYDSNTHYFYEVQVSGEQNDSVIISSNNSTLEETTNVDTETFTIQSINFTDSYATVRFDYDGVDWNIDSTSVNLTDYGITIDSQVTLSSGDYLIISLTKQTQFRNEILAKSILAGITPMLIRDEPFDYQMNQSRPLGERVPVIIDPEVPPESWQPIDDLVIEDIVSIFPKSTIEINSSESSVQQGSYTLKSNETIQLYSPNLISQQTYNNYVKFECKLNDPIDSTKVISPNTIYELQANEYIVFYWKSSSSDTIYSYAMYGEGSIIKPSFNIQTTSNITQVASTLYLEMLSLNQVPRQITSDLSPLNFEQALIIQNLKNTSNILSDNKSIEHLIANTITITNNMYCYWVLNQFSEDSEEEKYTLFEDGQTQRVLDTGEYFFYTNQEMTTLMTVGEGTLIINGDPSSVDSWTVSAIPLTDITLLGIDAIEGLWYKPRGYLTVTEEQFITINSEYEIKFQRKETEINAWKAIINHDGTQFSYVDDQIEEELSYRDFIISYRPNNSTTWIQIPDLDLGILNGWNGKSRLGLSISNTQSQQIFDNQSVEVTVLDGTRILIRGYKSATSQLHSIKPIMLLSTKDLYANGSQEISTIEYNIYHQPSYLSLYVFSEELSRTDIVTYTADGCNIPILKDNTSSEDYDSGSTPTGFPALLMLPEGSYIVPVYIPYYEDIYMQVYMGNQGTTLLKPLYDSNMTKLIGGKLYPLMFSGSSTYINNRIIIRLVDSSNNPVQAPEDMLIRFYNPIRYKQSENLAKNVALVKMFDNDNIFNYTYEVNSNIAINDPLDAKQFLNPNHIYKKYTICQLDTSNRTRIQVN